MKHIVFLGPPGAGKGTQAAGLARELGLLHLSTGELLRSSASAKTALGLRADGFMREGKLVPDEMVLAILQERLRTEEARRGFVLDGFPRTVAQAESLESMTRVDGAISFDIPEEVLIERLTQRRNCPSCGTVYNLVTQPPRDDERCDRDGTLLIQRGDDTVEAVRERLAVYRRVSAPLRAYYSSRNLLFPIDVRGSPEEVARRIRAIVAPAA